MARNLVIKTTMDNTDFDRKYNYLNKQLERELKNLDKLDKQEKKIYDRKLKLDFDDSEYERKMRELQSTYSKEAVHFNPDAPNAKQFLFENMMYEQQASELAGEYADVFYQLENIDNELNDIHQQQEGVNKKVAEYREELEKISNTKVGINVKEINDATKGFTKMIKKVAKWGLALFGIRAAYGAIRSAMSIVTQYNDELAKKVESIKYTLAMSLEPVITKLINLVYRLIQYVNYLAKAWFNVDLFANASAKSSKKAANAMKSLAGFDTANVLSDGSSGSGNPGAMSSLPEGKIPDWIKWMADNGETVAAIIAGITGAVLGLKFGFDLLTATGIGLLFAGIYLTVKGILDYIEDPSWNNFLTILEGIALIVAGIALLMGAWVVALIAVGVAIVAAIIKNWDEVKKILGVVGDWIYKNVIKPIGDFFKGLWDSIKNIFSTVGNFFYSIFAGAYNQIKKAFSSVTSFFKGVWNSIKSIFTSIGTTAANAFSGAFKSVINTLLKTVENVLNTPIKAINGLISAINTLPGVSIGKLSTFNLPRLATGGIVNNPGRGVPVGGAIAGEAGREGVLPLTDSNTMRELGQEIGKWVAVNIDLTTKLDSRVLSRSLEKVQSTNSFIRNGV